jgi:O-antigen ligase
MANQRSVRGPFDAIVVVLMALGSLVFVEPAPYDLLIVALAPIALLARRLAIPHASGVALICVGMFLLANTISLIPARDLDAGLRYFAITLYLVIGWAFLLGHVGKQGERAIQTVMLGWTGGATLSTAVAIAAYFNVIPLHEAVAPGGRMEGFFKDANVLGAFLVPPAVWSASRLVALERGRRSLWAVALVVCSAGVFLSYSRGAWISLGIAMVIFFALRLVGVGTRRSRVMTLLAVPIAAVLLAVALDRLTDFGIVQDMLELRLGPQAYDSERFANQRRAIEVAARSPFGIGPGHTEIVFRRAAHNVYVRGFVENGYLGGLSMTILLLASLLRSTWLALEVREPRLQVAMAMVSATLVALVVESMVIDSGHWRHTWVLLALAWTPNIGATRDNGP